MLSIARAGPTHRAGAQVSLLSYGASQLAGTPGCISRMFVIMPKICGRIDPINERVEFGLDDNVFVPAEIFLPALTEVTWVNYGHNQHTIQGPGWVGPVAMNPGGTWIVMYMGPGTYEYHCTIHPEMRQRLTIAEPVRASATGFPLQ